MNKQKDVVIIGAGGHAKVIADIIIKVGDNLIGFLDDNIEKDTKIICNYKVLGKIADCFELERKTENIEFIIGIGDNKIRKEIAENYKLNYYTAMHPNATIGMDVKICKGTVIMANSVINSGSTIGKHCIINTGAIIEHDNAINNYVHISPNAVLGGTVIIGESSHIGIGTVIKNNITVLSNCVIGAGGVVVKDIVDEDVYVGNPVKKLRS